MPWWGWILVGTLLLAAELFVVQADFYLVFLGFSALVVGTLSLVGLGGPLWTQWLIFAVVAVGSTVFFRRRVSQRLRRPGSEVSDSVVGEWVVVRDAIAPGGLGRAELRGTVWSTRNTGAAALPPGGRARVIKVEGLVLDVRSE